MEHHLSIPKRSLVLLQDSEASVHAASVTKEQLGVRPNETCAVIMEECFIEGENFQLCNFLLENNCNVNATTFGGECQ